MKGWLWAIVQRFDDLIDDCFAIDMFYSSLFGSQRLTPNAINHAS